MTYANIYIVENITYLNKSRVGAGNFTGRSDMSAFSKNKNGIDGILSLSKILYFITKMNTNLKSVLNTKALLFVVLAFAICMPAASASQTSFLLNPASPLFTFSEDQFTNGAGAQTLSLNPLGNVINLDIPNGATLSNAELKVTGVYQDFGTEISSPGIEVTDGFGMDNNVNTLVYENGLNCGRTVLTISGVFIVPENAISFVHKIQIFTEGDKGVTQFDVNLYNFKTQSWDPLMPDPYMSSTYNSIITVSHELAREHVQDNRMRLQYFFDQKPAIAGGNVPACLAVRIGGDAVARKQETTYTKKSVVRNPKLLMGNNLVWSFAGDLEAGSATINDANNFKTLLQNAVNACATGTMCTIPLNFTALFNSQLNINSLKVDYTYSPKSYFFEKKLGDGSSSSTFEASSNTVTRYIAIPAKATIETATLKLTGSYQDLGSTAWAMDVQTGAGALFDNDVNTEGGAGGINIGDYQNYTGNFTLPEYASTFSHKINFAAVGNIGASGGSLYISIYNYTAKEWIQLLDGFAAEGQNKELGITNYQLTSDLISEGKILLNYKVMSRGDQTYAGKLNCGGVTCFPLQSSSYGIVKSPQNSELAVGGVNVWSHAGQFTDIESETLNNLALKNAIQDKVNACAAGTICNVPLSFTSLTKGDITLSDISIAYTTSSSVTKKVESSSLTVVPGNTYYAADVLMLSSSSLLNIDVRYVDIVDNANTCWVNGVQKEKADLNSNGDLSCNIGSVIWPANTQNEIKVWTDAGMVVPASQSEGSKTQDESQKTIAGGLAYIKKQISLTNKLLDAIKNAINIAWTTSPEAGWACTSCSGTEDSIADGETRDVYAKMSADSVITKDESAPWVELAAGGHTLSQQNLEKPIGGINTGDLDFTNVAWSAAMPAEYTGDNKDGSFGILAKAPYAITATAHADVLEEGAWSAWSQDGTATLHAQTVASTLSVKNKDAGVTFTDVSWANANGPAVLNTPVDVNGKFNIGPSPDVVPLKSTYTGDALVEDPQWSAWKQDGALQVDGAVNFKSTRSVKNNENVAFSDVDIEKEKNDILGWTCSPSDLTINVPASGTATAESVCSKNNVVVSVSGGAGDWAQDAGKQTKAGGAAYVKGNLKVENREDIAFTNVNLAANTAAESRSGWTCAHDAKTFDIAKVTDPVTGGIWASADYPITCTKNNVITKTAGASVQDAGKVSTLSEQYAEKPYTIENTDAITYNSILWEGTNDWGEACDTCSGLLNLNKKGDIGAIVTESAKWHGDVLSESWSGWVQSGTATLSAQVIESTLSVANSQNIEFSGVAWSKAGPAVLSNCEDNTCSGTVDVPASGSSAPIKSKYSGDALAETPWGAWHQASAKLDGTVSLWSQRNIENDENVEFSHVDPELTSKPGWSCDGGGLENGIVPAYTTVPVQTECDTSAGLVSLEAADWKQDATKPLTVDGTVYIEGRAQAQNTLDENLINIEYGSENAVAQCKAGWSCSISGPFSDLSVAAGFTAKADAFNVKAEKIDVITSTAGGAGDWTQDTNQKMIAGGTAYIKGNVKVDNNADLVFTNVKLGANTATQSRTEWVCANAETIIPALAKGDWTSADYPIACTKTNVITKTASVPVQDGGKVSTLSEQYVEKPYTIENTDNIPYDSVVWEGTNDWGEACDSCSGSLTLNKKGDIGDIAKESAKWRGDVLSESWSEWQQSGTATLSAQTVESTLTVNNIDDNVDFTGVAWEKSSSPKDLSNCVGDCAGSLNIEKSGTASLKAIYTGDAIIETEWTDWEQSVVEPPILDGKVIMLSNKDIQNAGEVAFSNVVPDLITKDGWDCMGSPAFPFPVNAGYNLQAECSTSGVVSLEAADWQQDVTKTATVDGSVYTEGRAQAQNILDENLINIEYGSENAVAQCKAGWSCSISGPFSDLSVAAGFTAKADAFNVKAEKTGVITSTAGGAGDWAQDKSQKMVAGGTAYIKGNAKVANSEDLVFKEVKLGANTASQSRTEWACANAETIIPALAKGGWTSADYPIACTKNNVITKTASAPVQDGGKVSTLSEQYMEKPYTIENKDSIPYASVTWEGTNDWGTCDTCDGSLNLNAGDKATESAKWHGDVLSESWSGWVQSGAATLSAQTVESTLSVENSQNLEFSDVAWSKAGPAVFLSNCVDNTCSGTVNVPASGSASAKSTYSGDALVETAWTGFTQDGAVQVDSLVTIKATNTVENKESLAFDDVDTAKPNYGDWVCLSASTIDVPASGKVTAESVCSKDSVVVSVSGGAGDWAQDKSQKMVAGGTAYIKGNAKVANSEDLVFKEVKLGANTASQSRTEWACANAETIIPALAKGGWTSDDYMVACTKDNIVTFSKTDPFVLNPGENGGSGGEGSPNGLLSLLGLGTNAVQASSVEVESNLDIEATASLENTDDAVGFDVSAIMPIAGALSDTVKITDSGSGASIAADSIDYAKGEASWVSSLAADASANYKIAYKVSGPTFASKDADSSVNNLTSLKYTAKINVPNAFSSGLEIIAPLTVGDLSNWGNRTKIIAMVDGKQMDYELVAAAGTADKIKVKIPVSDGKSLSVGDHDVELLYYQPSVKGSMSKLESKLPDVQIVVGDKPAATSTFYNKETVDIKTKTGEKVVSFDYDFSASILNIENTTVEQISGVQGGAIIRGLELQNGVTKTVYVPRKSKQDKVCIADKDVASTSEIVCNTGIADTYEIACSTAGTVQNGYNCSITADGSYYMITGLKNSGILEKAAPAPPPDPGTGGGGGGSASNPKPKPKPVVQNVPTGTGSETGTPYVPTTNAPVNLKEEPKTIPEKPSIFSGFGTLISGANMLRALIGALLLAGLIGAGYAAKSGKFKNVRMPKVNLKLKMPPIVPAIKRTLSSFKSSKPAVAQPKNLQAPQSDMVKLKRRLLTPAPVRMSGIIEGKLKLIRNTTDQDITKILLAYGLPLQAIELKEVTGLSYSSLHDSLNRLSQSNVLEKVKKGKLIYVKLRDDFLQ